MIKHGRVYPFVKRAPTHLEPIKDYITKGVADAREKIVLRPKVCDIKGAKRFDAQQCVFARTINRELRPEAVAVGRTFTYVVFGGVAVRCRNPQSTTKGIEVFDEHGVASTLPVELFPIEHARRLRPNRTGTRSTSRKTRRPPTKKIGVRAIGGGVTRRAR